MPKKGSYCLIINKKINSKIEVGAIGQINFKKGYYIYIGSAMNSLIPRIKRHLSDNKKIHWHVDYLLKDKSTYVEEVIFNINNEKIECKLANSISKEGIEIANFGCSDCNCNSHLIYFENNEDCLKTVKNSYNKLKIDYFNLEYFKTIS
jgi:Uri superfamily endonuclease